MQLRRTREEINIIAEQLRRNIGDIGRETIKVPIFGWKKFLPELYIPMKPERLRFDFLAEVSLHKVSGWVFANSVLHHASCKFGDLPRADFTGAELFMADLEYANLKFANFRYANLIRSDLAQANLHGTDFTDADLSDANLKRAKFHKTKILPEALKSTEWWKADFTREPNLLAKVYEMYKDRMPILNTANFWEFHESVRKHIEGQKGPCG